MIKLAVCSNYKTSTGKKLKLNMYYLYCKKKNVVQVIYLYILLLSYTKGIQFYT